MPIIAGPGGVFVTVVPEPIDKEENTRREKAREERVQRLIERVSKSSPIGKRIIESALERGVSIGMEADKGGSLGSYMPSFKYVSLNERVSDEQLLSTIVHECRHSEQKMKRDMSYTVYASIAETRAIEADAMAHECAAVYQMRKSEPETYKLFNERHGGIMKAYEVSFEKNKDETKAKAEAFKAWYDHAEYVELYDRSVRKFMEMGQMHSGAYKQDLSVKVLSDNVPYVEPEFFTSQRASTVSEETAIDAAKIERGHIRHAFKIFSRSKLPTSADNFYVRDTKGNVTPPKAKPKPEKANAALMAKVAAKKER